MLREERIKKGGKPHCTRDHTRFILAHINHFHVQRFQVCQYRYWLALEEECQFALIESLQAGDRQTCSRVSRSYSWAFLKKKLRL